jgi:hypothetical protein
MEGGVVKFHHINVYMDLKIGKTWDLKMFGENVLFGPDL